MFPYNFHTSLFVWVSLLFSSKETIIEGKLGKTVNLCRNSQKDNNNL